MLRTYSDYFRKNVALFAGCWRRNGRPVRTANRLCSTSSRVRRIWGLKWSGGGRNVRLDSTRRAAQDTLWRRHFAQHAAVPRTHAVAIPDVRHSAEWKRPLWRSGLHASLRAQSLHFQQRERRVHSDSAPVADDLLLYMWLSCGQRVASGRVVRWRLGPLIRFSRRYLLRSGLSAPTARRPPAHANSSLEDRCPLYKLRKAEGRRFVGVLSGHRDLRIERTLLPAALSSAVRWNPNAPFNISSLRCWYL